MPVFEWPRLDGFASGNHRSSRPSQELAEQAVEAVIVLRFPLYRVAFLNPVVKVSLLTVSAAEGKIRSLALDRTRFVATVGADNIHNCPSYFFSEDFAAFLTAGVESPDFLSPELLESFEELEDSLSAAAAFL